MATTTSDVFPLVEKIVAGLDNASMTGQLKTISRVKRTARTITHNEKGIMSLSALTNEYIDSLEKQIDDAIDSLISGILGDDDD